MKLSRFALAIDEARLVKRFKLFGRTYVQAWYGGVTIRKFRLVEETEFIELQPGALSDEGGRPPSIEAVERSMIRDYYYMEYDHYMDELRAFDYVPFGDGVALDEMSADEYVDRSVEKEAEP